MESQNEQPKETETTACSDDEPIEDLREAVESQVKDGDIDADSLGD